METVGQIYTSPTICGAASYTSTCTMEHSETSPEKRVFPTSEEQWALRSVIGLTTVTLTSSSLIGFTRRIRCFKISGTWATNQEAPAIYFSVTSPTWLGWVRFPSLTLAGGL